MNFKLGENRFSFGTREYNVLDYMMDEELPSQKLENIAKKIVHDRGNMEYTVILDQKELETIQEFSKTFEL